MDSSKMGAAGLLCSSSSSSSSSSKFYWRQLASLPDYQLGQKAIPWGPMKPLPQTHMLPEVSAYITSAAGADVVKLAAQQQ